MIGLVDVFPAGARIPVPPPAVYGPGRRELVDALPLGLVDVGPGGPSRDNPHAPTVMHCESCRCDQ